MRYSQYLLAFTQKLPNKCFWKKNAIQKIFQEYLNRKLADSMEQFDYIGFKLALCFGANPNIDAKIQKGYHLVTRCARSGEVELLKLLLDFGGDIYGGEPEGGYMPIHMAASKGHAPVIELLIEYGADIHSLYQLEPHNMRKGWTPLICACQQNQTQAVITLLKLGANHLDKNDLGVYALDIAKKYKNKEMIQAILAAEKPVILKR